MFTPFILLHSTLEENSDSALISLSGVEPLTFSKNQNFSFQSELHCVYKNVVRCVHKSIHLSSVRNTFQKAKHTEVGEPTAHVSAVLGWCRCVNPHASVSPILLPGDTPERPYL